MAEVASAFVSLMPSAKGFGASTERQIGPQMTGVAKRTGSRFGKVFAYASMSPLKAIGAAAVGLFAVQKVKDFFSGAIDEARESQKVSALTAQVIKSTGGAAGISAKQVGDLANSISRMTGIDDEAIQGTENLLLTFKNLRNEAGAGNNIFNRATKIVTDMSVALGTGMKGAAIQVGKALNDPIKGITALTRVGVSFTKGQIDNIKALVASGKSMVAQKIILKELRSEFGGAAAAAATSGDKFKTAFANLQESVGLALLPLLDKLLDKGTAAINFLMTQVPPAFAAFKAAVMPVATVIGDFISNHLEAFKTALAALGGSAVTSIISLIGGSLVSVLVTLAGAMASPVALVGALVGAAVYAYTHFEGFRNTVNSLATSLRAQLVPVLQAVAAFVTTSLVPALLQIGNYVRANVLPALAQLGQFLVSQVLPAVAQVATFIVGTFYPAMLKIWASVAQKLKPAFDQLIATFRSQVLPTLTQAISKFREWWPAIQKVIEVVVKLYGRWIEFQATIAGKVLPIIIRLTGFLLSNTAQAILRNIEVVGRFIGALVKLGGVIVDRIQDAARFAQGVKEKFGEAVNFIQGIPGKIKAALGDLSNILYAAGRQVIEGLVRGILDKARDAAAAAASAAHAVANAAKGALGIHSPSRVFTDIGKWTMEGFENGITTAGPKVLKAMQDALARVLDKATEFRDGIASRLDSVKSAFSSLRDSIASTFAGDLFNVSAIAESLTETTYTAAQSVGMVFDQNLLSTKSHLQELLKAFKKLKGWGLPAQFLSQLFASGNGALILEMASGTKQHALADASLFGDVQSLSNQLGGQVAQNQYGDQIKRLENRLDTANSHLRHLDDLDKRIARAINAAVAHGQKKAS